VVTTTGKILDYLFDRGVKMPTTEEHHLLYDLLLDQGANKEARDSKEITVLEYAVNNGQRHSNKRVKKSERHQKYSKVIELLGGDKSQRETASCKYTFCPPINELIRFKNDMCAPINLSQLK